MPIAQRLARQIAELDPKLLARATATIAEVGEHIEAFMTGKKALKVARP